MNVPTECRVPPAESSDNARKIILEYAIYDNVHETFWPPAFP